MGLLNEIENSNTDPNMVQESEMDFEEKKVFTYKEPKWYTKLKNGDFDKTLIKAILFYRDGTFM